MPAKLCRIAHICKGGMLCTVSFETNQVVPQKKEIIAKAQYPLWMDESFKFAKKTYCLHAFGVDASLNC